MEQMTLFEEQPAMAPLASSVNEKVGIKIPLSNPKQSVTDFANAINKLESNRQLLKEMSENCKQRQTELSWDNKALQMAELYNKVLK